MVSVQGAPGVAGGDNSKTMPRPWPPPMAAAPTRLPALSKTTPAIGSAPSRGLEPKLYKVVSVCPAAKAQARRTVTTRFLAVAEGFAEIVRTNREMHFLRDLPANPMRLRTFDSNITRCLDSFRIFPECLSIACVAIQTDRLHAEQYLDPKLPRPGTPISRSPGRPAICRGSANTSQGVRVRVATLSAPFRDAEIVALIVFFTILVVTTTVAEVAPSGIVTLTGMRALKGLLLCRLTTKPPAGAGPVNVIVALELTPPFTVAGFRSTEDRVEATADPLTCR